MKSFIPIDDLHDPMGNKGCVTLWPCHLHSKVSISRQNIRMMETQIFHHAKIIIFKKSSKINQKYFKILLL
jgi:hypothetical protein